MQENGRMRAVRKFLCVPVNTSENRCIRVALAANLDSKFGATLCEVMLGIPNTASIVRAQDRNFESDMMFASGVGWAEIVKAIDVDTNAFMHNENVKKRMCIYEQFTKSLAYEIPSCADYSAGLFYAMMVLHRMNRGKDTSLEEEQARFCCSLTSSLQDREKLIPFLIRIRNETFVAPAACESETQETQFYSNVRKTFGVFLESVVLKPLLSTTTSAAAAAATTTTTTTAKVSEAKAQSKAQPKTTNATQRAFVSQQRIGAQVSKEASSLSPLPAKSYIAGTFDSADIIAEFTRLCLCCTVPRACASQILYAVYTLHDLRHSATFAKLAQRMQLSPRKVDRIAHFATTRPKLSFNCWKQIFGTLFRGMQVRAHGARAQDATAFVSCFARHVPLPCYAKTRMQEIASVMSLQPNYRSLFIDLLHGLSPKTHRALVDFHHRVVRSTRVAPALEQSFRAIMHNK